MDITTWEIVSWKTALYGDRAGLRGKCSSETRVLAYLIGRKEGYTLE